MDMQYYEDIKVGQKYQSREYLLTAEDIIAYARQWDPEPFHIDLQMAKASPFGGLIASGFHLLSICKKLTLEDPAKTAIIAGLGMREIRFEAAARPGDILIAEYEIVAKRKSKGVPNAGLAYSVGRLLNQKGETVLTLKGTALVKKRGRE